MPEYIVQRTTAWERFNHWVLAISFIILCLTGLGFLFHSLNWLNTIFGGNHLAKEIHRWTGVVFTFSVLFTLGSYLGESLRFTKEDSQWLSNLGGYLSKTPVEPPQGRLNAGQKVYYLVVVVLCGAVIIFSGFVLWLAPSTAGWLRFGYLLHNLTFVVFVTTVPLHIYLSTAANPGTFRGMTRGTVSKAWAKRHHSKWAKELGID
jgi:formate dehydrogenase subunit gamma